MEWGDILAETKELEIKGLKVTLKKWNEAASRSIIIWGTGVRRIEEKSDEAGTYYRYEVDEKSVFEQTVLQLLHGIEAWNLPGPVNRENVSKFLDKGKPEIVREVLLAIQDFNRLDDEKKTS